MNNFTEVKNQFFISNNRLYHSDIILKSEIPRKMFENNVSIFQKCDNRENIEYCYFFKNVMSEDKQTSTLYFIFLIASNINELKFLEEAIHLIEAKIKEEDINENEILEYSEYDNKNFILQSNEETLYNISFSINVLDIKMINFHVPNYSNKIILKEISLSTYGKDDITIITETFIKKLYNAEINFTGIVNEAMTCYMNCFLQTLNIMGYFKKALYKIEPENTEDIAYCLQRFFYDMSTQKEPISTNKLVRSFGWSREDIFIQHDVQEFNMVLSDIMEKKMKGTESENTFKYLFEGKQLSYIKCLDVDYESNRSECFNDIQLTVKGCKGLYESFDNYIQKEILDGEDKYQADGYGLQKAEIGKKFINLPNVMILQLKRFEYNAHKDSMEKINDYFEFYSELDMRKYVDNPEDSEEYGYTLHSVIVHKGNIGGGHYYAFIRPDLADNWYCFNDEIVRVADNYEVFQGNFGGQLKIYKHKHNGLIREHLIMNDANAYILIYVKNTEREKILNKITEKDVNLS